jgi:hypothetical protein
LSLANRKIHFSHSAASFPSHFGAAAAALAIAPCCSRWAMYLGGKKVNRRQREGREKERRERRERNMK